MKTYSVLVINEKGVYHTVATGVSGSQAGAIKRNLTKKGIWTQLKEEN